MLRDRQHFQFGIGFIEFVHAQPALGDGRLIAHHDGQVFRLVDLPHGRGRARQQAQVAALTIRWPSVVNTPSRSRKIAFRGFLRSRRRNLARKDFRFHLSRLLAGTEHGFDSRTVGVLGIQGIIARCWRCQTML